MEVKVVVPTLNGCRFFFFFQAEDGIRDHGVTGVQTCALPICARPGAGPLAAHWRRFVEPWCRASWRPTAASSRSWPCVPGPETSPGPHPRHPAPSAALDDRLPAPEDRKSTRLNSSHTVTSYAV